MFKGDKRVAVFESLNLASTQLGVAKTVISTHAASETICHGYYLRFATPGEGSLPFRDEDKMAFEVSLSLAGQGKGSGPGGKNEKSMKAVAVTDIIGGVTMYESKQAACSALNISLRLMYTYITSKKWHHEKFYKHV